MTFDFGHFGHKIFIFQEEIKQAGIELSQLEFRREVLQKQKTLLTKFANNISTVHSMKVIILMCCL